jgi:hypothetical protein
MAVRIGIRGQTIVLYVQFFDTVGNPANADDTPTVAIYDSDGTLEQAATDVGVSLVRDAGLYSFTYEIPLDSPDGYAEDRWSAKIGDDTLTASFEYLVISDGTIEESDEYDPYPGDDHTFVFTDDEVTGVNLLLRILKARVKNDGVRRVSDGAGSYVEMECSVFSDDELICFLVASLSEFNQTPHFSTFTFADQQIQETFMHIVTQGAALLAMAAQALLEKGREFVLTDAGVSYQPPAISEILSSQYSTQLADYRQALRAIKTSLKPTPLGLGTFRVSAIAPAYLRLRHLRSRQVV